MADRRKASDEAGTFPAPAYARSVLEPLFETAKARFAEPMRRIDRAHLVMLAETAILGRDDAAAIARAITDIEADGDLAAATYTGEVEDYFFLAEKALDKRLGPDLAGRLHTARSRNDVDHTAFRIVLKARLDRLMAEARGLAAAMIATATRERATLVVAYTHGQPAQPTTFGHYLGAAIEVLLRDLERLEAAYAIVDRSPMGAAAITTTGFAIDRERVARLLGFSSPLENAYGAIAAVDYLTATYSAIGLAFLHLGRVVQDLLFWSSFEIGQLRVPDGYVQISSIMPQKRNPVAIEHLRHLCSATVGQADMVVGVMHNTPFTDMNDSEGEVQLAGYAAFESAARVLDLMTGIIGAVSIDAARVSRNIERSCITITELADTLVRLEGLAFRRAHQVAAATARQVVAERSSLAEAGYRPFAEAFASLVGRPPRLDEAGFAEVVSPEHFVAVRERLGGPAPAALDAALTRYREALDGLGAQASARARRHADAEAELERAFSALAG